MGRYLMGNPYLDDRLFEFTCRDLEAALGKERYDQALERGKRSHEGHHRRNRDFARKLCAHVGAG